MVAHPRHQVDNGIAKALDGGIADPADHRGDCWVVAALERQEVEQPEEIRVL